MMAISSGLGFSYISMSETTSEFLYLSLKQAHSRPDEKYEVSYQTDKRWRYDVPYLFKYRKTSHIVISRPLGWAGVIDLWRIKTYFGSEKFQS